MRFMRFVGVMRSTPPRRRPASKLAFEPLEDRCLLSAVGWEQDYETWKNQTFSIGGLGDMVASIDPQGLGGSAQSNQSLNLIGAPHVQQNYGYTGSGYTVAILDTGVDYTHSALAANYIGGWDFVDNDADPMDLNGHGTHVAGIIASTHSVYRGVAPNVNFIALRVLDAGGSGSFANVEKALRWVATYQAQYNIVAVNMSLGAGNFAVNPWTFMEDELSTLKSQGVFVAAASGNSFYTYGSQQGLGYPAISPLTVSVGAVWDASYGSVNWGSGARDFTTGADRITSFTQRSAGLDILAPGAFLTNTYLGGGFASLAGTSMAAPMVAGAAALMHQALDATGQGHLANQDYILSIMKSTGITIIDGDDENDNVTNTWLSFKRLNLLAAIDQVRAGGTPGGGSTPTSTFVTSVYQELLGRSPDAGGLVYWTNMIQQGVSRTLVARSIWVSPEFKGYEIDSYYTNFLNRTPGAGERSYWTNQLIATGSDTAVAVSFLTSGEYTAAHASSASFVDALYQDVLNRTPEAGGRQFWISYLDSGGSRAAMSEMLLLSAEQRLNVIDSYYQRFLGRTPGQSERMWWLNQVASGATALRAIGESFLGSNEYFVRSAGASGSSSGGSGGASAASLLAASLNQATDDPFGSSGRADLPSADKTSDARPFDSPRQAPRTAATPSAAFNARIANAMDQAHESLAHEAIAVVRSADLDRSAHRANEQLFELLGDAVDPSSTWNDLDWLAEQAAAI